MAHVIDSFVVELGLDPTKFNEQQRKVVDNTKKSIDQSRKQTDEFERHADRIGDSLSNVRSQASGLFTFLATAVGGGFVGFAASAVHAGAEVGRLSRAIGVSANEISKWQGVAQEFGSTGEAMAGSFKALSNVFTAWQVGGSEAPGIMQIFRVINTEAERLDKNNAKTIDGTKGVAQSYRDLADNLKIIHDLAQDKNLSSYLAGKIPGMDAGLFDLLITGSQGVGNALSRLVGLTKEEAEAAGQLDRQWNHMLTTLTQWGQSNILKTFATDLQDLKAAAGFVDRLFGTSLSKSFEGTPANNTRTGLGAPSGAFTSKAEKEAFIRAEAIRQGQNPDVWVKLAKSEGFNQFNGDYDATGKPTSFGATQLHYPGIGRNTADGLGTRFTQETGLDARKPENEAAAIAWSMRYARTAGLSDWHGWKGAKYANLEGAKGGDSSSTTVSITGPITIQTGPNASASDIAAKLRDLGMRRQQEGNQSSVGGQ